MSRRAHALVVITTLLLGAGSPQAWSQTPTMVDGPVCGQKGCQTEASGTDKGTIAVGVTASLSDKVPGRGIPATHGDAPGRRQWLTVEEYVAPACSGNSLDGPDLLCTAAVTSCAAEDQVRFFIWHRETSWVRDDAGGETSTVGEWTQLPGSYCLGPDDPGMPTIGQVIAQVQRAFQDLPLPVAGVRVDPAPTSLVNIPTAFFAGGQQEATFTPTILGTQVSITATPAQWQWTWGDGTSMTTDNPGVPKRPVVAHEYTRSADYSVGVTTTWTGTFTVAGSPEVFQIRTPAIVQTPPVTVQVREARTELVDG